MRRNLIFLILLTLVPTARAQAPSFESQLGQILQAAHAARSLAPEIAELIRVALDPSLPEADRLAAIKELRFSAPHHREASEALRSLAVSSDEPTAVRRRSVQSLGAAIGLPNSQYRETLRVLRKLSGEDSEPMEVRVMALKALHWATVNEREDRRTMVRWAQAGQPLPLRMGALWALTSTASYDEVTPTLRSAFSNRSEPQELRNQALKSLYPLSDREEVWREAVSAALNPLEELELRETATLFLSGARRHREVIAALQTLASDPEPRVSAAATKAGDNAAYREIWEFFRMRFDPVLHLPIEVLELE